MDFTLREDLKFEISTPGREKIGWLMSDYNLYNSVYYVTKGETKTESNE